MFARSIRMIFLSMIFVFVATFEARACDHVVAAAGDRQEAISPEQVLIDVTKPMDVVQVTRMDSPDVDGCLPGCCNSNVCCHLIAVSPFLDLWSAGDEVFASSVATVGTPRSSEPDVPPPKAV